MLAPWKENWQTRELIEKQRHHFANKGLYSQSCGLSSSHVQNKSWAIMKAECWRTDAFQLWCWRRFLRVPWAARRSNQSILKEINPEYSLEKTLMLGKIEDGRRRGRQRMKWLDGITDSMDMNLGKVWEMVRDRESCAACSPRGWKQPDMTWQLNKNNLHYSKLLPTTSSKKALGMQLW